MEPKIGQVWEWDIDRKEVKTFVIDEMLASTHEIEVVCEHLEGEDSGTKFQTSAGSFNNQNWRLLYGSLEAYKKRNK